MFPRFAVSPSVICAARSRLAISAIRPRPLPRRPYENPHRHLSPIRKDEFNVQLGCAHRIDEKNVSVEKGLAVLVIGTMGMWMV
ncbi:hypothetical protein ACHAXA_006924 [Cyclostephanos tholiformis]|uniref:Uncharacterized protein n=1 Tax=Cyclostephanos tholiformis TaxID=382380 RepID=A0ABD3RRT9_9STRA